MFLLNLLWIELRILLALVVLPKEYKNMLMDVHGGNVEISISYYFFFGGILIFCKLYYF